MSMDVEKDARLFIMLQLMGGLFPTGGFSHSYGLETYVCSGRIKNSADLKAYLAGYIQSVLKNCDGAAFKKAYEQRRSLPEIEKLDKTVTAMKLTKESRSASLKTGRALARMADAAFRHEEFAAYCAGLKDSADMGNYCVAAGLISGFLGVDKKQALLSFLFGSVAGIAQSGVKLIPLGQKENQRMLFELYPQMIQAGESIMNSAGNGLTNFAPALDIASMNHERLYTRLYMS